VKLRRWASTDSLVGWASRLRLPSGPLSGGRSQEERRPGVAGTSGERSDGPTMRRRSLPTFGHASGRPVLLGPVPGPREEAPEAVEMTFSSVGHRQCGFSPGMPTAACVVEVELTRTSTSPSNTNTPKTAALPSGLVAFDVTTMERNAVVRVKPPLRVPSPPLARPRPRSPLSHGCCGDHNVTKGQTRVCKSAQIILRVRP
jgi:hypothetical protein